MLIETDRSTDYKVVFKADKFFMYDFLSYNFRMVLIAKYTKFSGKSLFSRSLELLILLEAAIEVVL